MDGKLTAHDLLPPRLRIEFYYYYYYYMLLLYVREAALQCSEESHLVSAFASWNIIKGFIMNFKSKQPQEDCMRLD